MGDKTGRNLMSSTMARILQFVGLTAVTSSGRSVNTCEPVPGTRRGPFLDVASTVCVGVLLSALVVATLMLRGDWNPDWSGYEAIYLEEGAWLADLGRDPGFTWLMRGARELFRNQGYETFRWWLAVYFFAVAALVAHTLARPYRKAASAAGVGLVLFAIVFTKFTVQIREGLALSFALAAVYVIARPPTGARFRAHAFIFCVLVLAVLFHEGTVYLLGAYALALSMPFILGNRVRSPNVSRAMSLLAIASGLAVGAYLEISTESTVEMLSGLGVASNVEALSSMEKTVYWISYGLLVLALRRQADDAALELGSPSALAFSTLLTSGILPFTYTLALYMVVTAQVPTATSIASRLLSTAVGLTMFFVVVRGRVNAVTVLVAVFTIVDQIRTIVAAAAS